MGKAKEFIEKVTVTRGMANAGKDIKATCKCGVKIPRYPGRYPLKCPECNADIVYPDVKGMGDEE